MSIFARFLLTFTAMIPAFLIASFVFWFNGNYSYMIISWLFIAALLIFLFFIIEHIKKHGEKISVNFKYARADNNSNMDYCLFYLSPLLNLKNDIIELWILVIIAFVFVIVKTASADCSFNPILRIFGWHFYNIETHDNVAHLVMTKKPIRNTKNPIEAVRMTEYVLLRID